MDSEEITLEEIKTKVVRSIENYPKPGILFKDITPIFLNPKATNLLAKILYERLSKLKFDAIVGIESRGFPMGFHLAMLFNKPFVIARKPGKLPAKTISVEYGLEYGKNVLEMHADSLQKDMKVIIHDDLLATGGTASAAAELCNTLGAKVEAFCFLIELEKLNGKQKLEKFSKSIESLMIYS